MYSSCFFLFIHLELLPRLNKDGTPAKTRAPTKFSLFVKDNYGKIKAKDPTSSHQEIMKELSKQFAQQVMTCKQRLALDRTSRFYHKVFIYKKRHSQHVYG